MGISYSCCESIKRLQLGEAIYLKSMLITYYLLISIAGREGFTAWAVAESEQLLCHGLTVWLNLAHQSLNIGVGHFPS